MNPASRRGGRQRSSDAPGHRPAPDQHEREARDRLAQRVREARQGRMTVEELAAASGVSSGAISQIERGGGNPSYTTLLKVGRALGLPLGAFFSDDSGLGRALVHKDRRKTLVLPDGLAYELLTPDFQHQLAVFRTTVPPGFDNVDFANTHPGEECIHVLAGHIVLRSASEVFELETGDAVTHDAGRPHSIANPTRRPAQLIIAVTPVTF